MCFYSHRFIHGYSVNAREKPMQKSMNKLRKVGKTKISVWLVSMTPELDSWILAVFSVRLIGIDWIPELFILFGSGWLSG